MKQTRNKTIIITAILCMALGLTACQLPTTDKQDAAEEPE